MSSTFISLRAPRRSSFAAAVISSLALFGAACTSSQGGRTPTGAAGTTGAAGSGGAAGSAGAAGSTGSTGTAGGGAGTSGASGAGGSAGTTGGASGSTGTAGTGAAGTNADGGASMDASLAPFDGFGENVIVFDPAMSATDMQAKIDAIYANSSVNAGQFATARTVYLFKPGAYQLVV